MKCFDGKRILIIGGTGSLGKSLVRRFLSGRGANPEDHCLFARRSQATLHAHGIPEQDRGHG